MNLRLHPRSLACFVALLSAQGCDREPEMDEAAAASLDPKSSAVFGQAPAAEAPDAARRIATRAVENAASQCGGGCSADLEAGRMQLGAGRMREAFDALQCGNTPGAAFGAGIAKLLGVVEGPAGDQVLKDLGQVHFPASDVFGPTGYLARAAARWNGTAELTVSGALALSIDSSRVMADDWELTVRHNDGARRVSLYVETDTSWTPGTLVQLNYDCANFGRALGPTPQISLSVQEGELRRECYVPGSLPQGCTPDGGSMRVVSSGSTVGADVALEFTNLRIACDSGLEDDVSGIPSFATLSGSVSAKVSGEIVTSDLHPVFDGDEDEMLIERTDPALTVGGFMSHGAAVAGELAVARCYFDKAAQGSGTVFTVPGSLHAGEDLALDAADARMFGAASATLAALIQVMASYEIALPFRSLVCMAQDVLGEHPLCPTTAAFIESGNAAWKGARIRHDRIEAARQLVALGLSDFEAGAPKLSESSALVRNSISAPGWRTAQDLAQAARQSLSSGMVAVPHVTPALHADLKGFFAAPPDPAAIATPLLVRSGGECVVAGECSDEPDIHPAYLSEFFDDTDLDFEDADYEFLEGEAIEDGLREVVLQLDAAGLFSGD